MNSTARILCDNLNHRRSDAPVRHCPQCGLVVNERIAPRACDTNQHAQHLRQRAVFCIDCGRQLKSLHPGAPIPVR